VTVARVAMALIVASVGCASTDPNLTAGTRAFQQGQWQPSIEKLEAFATQSCGTRPSDPSACKEAHTTMGEAYLHVGEPRNAYLALERARWYGPAEGPATDRIDQLERAAHDALSARQRASGGTGRFAAHFTSQTHGRLRFSKLTLALDLGMLHGEGRIDGETASMTVAPTAIAAGEHELDVIAVYEGAGTVRSDYRLAASRDEHFTVSDGELVDIEVKVVEDPAWTTWPKALNVTFDVTRPR
jgi:hypothetical protein